MRAGRRGAHVRRGWVKGSRARDVRRVGRALGAGRDGRVPHDRASRERPAESDQGPGASQGLERSFTARGMPSSQFSAVKALPCFPIKKVEPTRGSFRIFVEEKRRRRLRSAVAGRVPGTPLSATRSPAGGREGPSPLPRSPLATPLARTRDPLKKCTAVPA